VDGYDAHASERYVDEPPKDVGAGRTPFERDRARVLHSAALRRLAAKTQVVVAGEDDFPRTRLTHSLEVAQIGRELGAELGCDPDIVDAAGLAHDLGHPPFGHNGEDALDALAQPCGGFEGNAQTLRVLTRLECKTLHPDGASAGLNLTRAVLDAAAKYPWPRRPGTRKFGVYADDMPVFTWLRAGAPGDTRCLEAQVMDWSDDVAYSVHDVEDGVHAGYIRRELLDDSSERAAVCELAGAVHSTESAGDLATVLDELLALPVFDALRGYDGGLRSQVALKRLTSTIVGRFCRATVLATREASGGGPLRRYAADLVVPRRIRAECALLKAVALRYVMGRAGAEAQYERQTQLLTDLVELVAKRAPDSLDQVFHPLWNAAPGDAARLRVVVDQVACLTDRSVLAWHERLS
jgi:dGTPase